MQLTNTPQLWKVDASGEERKVTYLATLQKHTQAVNVVRWCPRGVLQLNLSLKSHADRNR
jgi:chromatin assembly factor 1 subunit B